LTEDNRAIFKSAIEAQKALDFIETQTAAKQQDAA
jgi:antirestriction protein ArdC